MKRRGVCKKLYIARTVVLYICELIFEMVRNDGETAYRLQPLNDTTRSRGASTLCEMKAERLLPRSCLESFFPHLPGSAPLQCCNTPLPYQL